MRPLYSGIFPRKFKVKDDLYEQDLYLLQLQMKWENTKYAPETLLGAFKRNLVFLQNGSTRGG